MQYNGYVGHTYGDSDLVNINTLHYDSSGTILYRVKYRYIILFIDGNSRQDIREN